MKVLAIGFVLIASFFVSSNVFSQETNSDSQHVASLSAQIKSQTELETYIKLIPKNKSPFRFFSNKERIRFLSSLTFNDKGLTGFNFSSLEVDLDYDQAYQVMSLFGAQYILKSLTKYSKVQKSLMAISADTRWQKCDGTRCNATTDDVICMSSCK